MEIPIELETVLHLFGQFLAPSLVRIYSYLASLMLIIP